jgi:hypothetical protein
MANKNISVNLSRKLLLISLILKPIKAKGSILCTDSNKSYMQFPNDFLINNSKIVNQRK